MSQKNGKDILKNLDPTQAEAVKQTKGPVLVLAGAGSGKTRVLTYKVAHLISSGVKSDNILAVTFTNKAANEMKVRIGKLVGTILKNKTPYVGTFHAFCAKLLRIDGRFIGLPAGYVIFDDNDSLMLVKRIMKDSNIAVKSFKPSSILNAISSAKGELVNAIEYAGMSRGYFGSTVAEVYTLYQKELNELNACDFDDLLFKTVELFKKNPNILEKYSGRFKYVLVDEYQDVNTAQYTLTKLLSSVHGNLTVVGDASQAIYSFRGADFRNILNFERDFPKVKIFNLEQNYRSTQIILDAANSIISKNESHPVLKLWTKNISGEKINIYNALNEVDEANFIIDKINSSRLPLSSYGILYRTNAQSRNIEEAFLHSNIPYRLHGGVRFYERKEIKDVLAYLRLIENPKDKIAMNRTIKIGKRRYAKFEELVEKIKSRKRKPKPIELIDKVLDATDYIKLIDDGTDQGLSRIENVKELKSVAADFENLSTLLESIALMEDKSTPEKNYDKETGDVVTLMTIHSAKGLEFDNVFVVGMEEGLFPHSRSMLEASQLEEERRLAYVATTRARRKLYLSYATQRLIFGTRNVSMVSRFITDIPEELLTTA